MKTAETSPVGLEIYENLHLLILEFVSSQQIDAGLSESTKQMERQ